MQPPQKATPAGTRLAHVKMVRLSDADLRRLRTLTERLETTEAVVLRQGLRELAKREGVEP